MKTKAEGDEIDSLNTLVNELYDRLLEVEKRGTSIEIVAGNPNL